MSLSDSDIQMIKRVQLKQLSPKRKGMISFDCASLILSFIRVPPLDRESIKSLSCKTGLSKTKIYTVIRDYEAEGVEYKSIPNGFAGVYQRQRHQASESLDK